MAKNITKNLFLESLYAGKDIPDVLKKYEKALRNEKELTSIVHANKIQEYNRLITNKNLLFRIRSNFNEIYKLIDKKFPDLRFSIDGRRKSLISVEKKIMKLLQEGRSLDSLRDIYAFRIILFGSNTTTLVNRCYDIANEIIKHSLQKGIIICEADSPQGTGNFIPSEYPDVIVPKNSAILSQFKQCVKDYLITPKENGYQSLHLLFKATTGECFEVQLRTFDMHLHAESGDARHDVYKTSKYKQTLDFDPAKVNIPGFGVGKNGRIFDMVGLQEGLQILKRQKTY